MEVKIKRVILNCKEHENQWRELCDIDKDIRVEWLESINNLRLFRPYSSCEGHPVSHGSGSDRQHARIWLCLKSEYYPSLAALWTSTNKRLQELFSKCFSNPDTKGKISHLYNGQEDFICNFPEVPTGRVSNYSARLLPMDRRIGIGLNLDHAFIRETEEMPEIVSLWFSRTVQGLVYFDRLLTDEIKI